MTGVLRAKRQNALIEVKKLRRKLEAIYMLVVMSHMTWRISERQYLQTVNLAVYTSNGCSGIYVHR